MSYKSSLILLIFCHFLFSPITEACVEKENVHLLDNWNSVVYCDENSILYLDRHSISLLDKRVMVFFFFINIFGNRIIYNHNKIIFSVTIKREAKNLES